MFKDRTEILTWLNTYRPGGVGVEIGVAGAHFSKNIIRYWPSVRTLYLVDLWKHQETGYNDGCNLSDDKQEERYQGVIKYFKDNQRVKVIRDWSHVAAEMFFNNYFDFIYIDANHSYEGCKKDLLCWGSKIKHDGILAGHDYAIGPEDRYCVKKAVDEYAKNNFLDSFLGETSEKFDRDGNFEGKSWFIMM